MKLRLQSDDIRENPVEVRDLQVVVLFDDYDQPVYVWIRQANGGIFTSSIEDANFQQIVREMGLLSRASKPATFQELQPCSAPISTPD